LTENRDKLAEQAVKVESVFRTSMDLSAIEVTLFNNLLDSILEEQVNLTLNTVF